MVPGASKLGQLSMGASRGRGRKKEARFLWVGSITPINCPSSTSSGFSSWGSDSDRDLVLRDGPHALLVRGPTSGAGLVPISPAH